MTCTIEEPVKDRVLTDAEAVCYFKNYPTQAQSLKDSGIALDAKSASFTYNYILKNQGIKRNLQCPVEKPAEPVCNCTETTGSKDFNFSPTLTGGTYTIDSINNNGLTSTS